MSFRRVVVTGLGLVTPLGSGTWHVWENLVASKCGIRQLLSPEYQSIPCRIAGVVPVGEGKGMLNINEAFSSAEQRSMSRSSLFAVSAAKEALCMAQWHPSGGKDALSTGVSIGVGMVDLSTIVEAGLMLQQFGYKKISPYFVPVILPNMASGNVSLKFGLRGPNHSASTACAAGAHGIGDAARMIMHGDADVMVCGGSEASVNSLALAGFCRAKALCTDFNDKPEKASMPFDVKRCGFVMGEGAGVLILEELNHALARKANIYAEMKGYGLSGDAVHITAPRSDGTGVMMCMDAAIRDAGIKKEDIMYINAHATSTLLGDDAECRAIKAYFGPHAQKLAISSSKGAIGHLLGAAGAVEAVFTVLTCYTKVVPPTLNLEDASDHKDLNLVPNMPQKLEPVNGSRFFALSNSFGFGGTNASLCFSDFSGE